MTPLYRGNNCDTLLSKIIQLEYLSWKSNPGSLVQMLHFYVLGFAVVRCCVSAGAAGVYKADSP